MHEIYALNIYRKRKKISVSRDSNMYTTYKGYISLACDAVSLGNDLPTFRKGRDFMVRVKHSGELWSVVQF